MVDTQVRPSDVTKFPIIDAMLSVPRELFVPSGLKEAAYIGENLPLGEGRVMLEPRTFAKLLDALAIEADDVVLDIGCGLGYSTAILAHMVDFVVATEASPDVVAEAQSNLSENGYDNAAVVEGALKEGVPKSGPYDVIIVQGAVQSVPTDLTAQLKEGGRIAAIFMDGALGVARVGRMSSGRVSWRDVFNASAPLLPGFELEQDFAL